jgi:Rrf2 family transcriptional regulator, nitric oxide-sensitive transcriptional repressor
MEVLMRYTDATDYSLRILSSLLKDQRMTTSKALSKKLGLPASHVSKLVHDLAKGGYITAVKGKNGGIMIKEAARRRTLKDLIEHIEGPLLLRECIIDPGMCSRSRDCEFREILKEAGNAMTKILNGYQIKDIGRRN